MKKILPLILIIVFSCLSCLVETQADSPRITPVGGTILPTQLISISSDIPGASIYYTTDGSLPTSHSELYQAPFLLEASSVVRAIAVAEGFTDSNEGMAAFDIEDIVFLEKNTWTKSALSPAEEKIVLF